MVLFLFHTLVIQYRLTHLLLNIRGFSGIVVWTQQNIDRIPFKLELLPMQLRLGRGKSNSSLKYLRFSTLPILGISHAVLRMFVLVLFSIISTGDHAIFLNDVRLSGSRLLLKTHFLLFMSLPRALAYIVYGSVSWTIIHSPCFLLFHPR